MPFSNQSTMDMHAQTLPVLQERYALRRCMAETALGKLYWAQDFKQSQLQGEQANVLVFTLSPLLSQNPQFETAFGNALSSFQKPSPSMPLVSDDGKTQDGLLWMVLKNINGMLLSERLDEVDERGVPLAEAHSLLDKLNDAIACYRPDGIFGFMEPGAVLLTEQNACLLTAPIVTALRNSYYNGQDNNSRQTLHSTYISPEILLGDRPVSHDDTFSLACVAYHLLQGESAYHRQSTLEAAVRGIKPHAIRKLRPEAWQILQQGIALKREKRHTEPQNFLRLLRQKQRRKMVVPIAAVAASLLFGFTAYTLFSSTNNTTPPPTPLAEEQRSEPHDNNTITANNTTQTPTPSTVANNTAQQSPQIQQLLEQASSEIRRGNLVSQEANRLAAADYLRQALVLNPKHEKTQLMLRQLIKEQHNEIEVLLSAGKADDASRLLDQADQLITEFTLVDALNNQMALEAAVARMQTDKPTNDDNKRYLALTQEAIELGNLLEGDAQGNDAVTFVKEWLQKKPDNLKAQEVLKELVSRQQAEARTQLSAKNFEQARRYLDASQKLIAQYRVEEKVGEQITLEQYFRDMDSQIASTDADREIPLNTIQASSSAQEDPADHLNRTQPVAQVQQPVEVRVSPDLPIETAVQTPPPPPRPNYGNTTVTTLPPQTDLAVQEVSSYQPPTPAQHNTFTPDVPELMEIPLDTITEEFTLAE